MFFLKFVELFLDTFGRLWEEKASRKASVTLLDTSTTDLFTFWPDFWQGFSRQNMQFHNATGTEEDSFTVLLGRRSICFTFRPGWRK